MAWFVWPFLSPKELYHLLTQLSYTLDVPFLLLLVYRAVPAHVCTKGEKEGTLGTLRVGFNCCPYVLGSVGRNPYCPMTLVRLGSLRGQLDRLE